MKLKIAVLALVVCSAWAMTDEEATHFHNSGKYGGRVSVTDNGNSHTLNSDGLPDHPIVMVNPNTPQSMSDVYTIPKEPTVTDKPGCLSLGAVGMAVTGSLIFDPLNAEGENAVEGSGAETFDQYGGHTAPRGQYHYHKLPGSFLYNGEPDKLLGVALDGFPIYGPMASDLERNVKNTDLDMCHGRYVNGKYRYHANYEFPYLLGCYRGSTVSKAHTIYGVCNGTSTFDAEWGYLCACPGRGHGGGRPPMNQQGFRPQGYPMNQQGNQQPMMPQQGTQQPMNSQQGNQQPMIPQQGNQQHMNPQQGNQQPMNTQQGNQQPMNAQQGNQQPMNPQHPFRPPIGQNHQGYPFGHLGHHHPPPPDGGLFGKK